MSTNGSNGWDVPFSQITWFDRLLRTHSNVEKVSRHHDIVFEVNRKQPSDHLTILCCRQYTMGLTLVQRALAEFGQLHIIYIGGGWCGYTSEAKHYCLENRIGIYVSDEMSGALWKEQCWAYHKKDKDGNPEYFVRD